MATESERVNFGMTDKGQVVMIRKDHFTDDGERTVYSYEVRHGVRTIGEYAARSKAEAVAKALTID